MRPALVVVGDSSGRVAIPIFGTMHERVVRLSADPRPVHLDAGFIGLPRPGCSLAVLRLVPAHPVQAQLASFDLRDHGGPFLGSLRPEHLARGEAVLVPGLAVSVFARVKICTGRTSSGRRLLRPVIPLEST